MVCSGRFRAGIQGLQERRKWLWRCFRMALSWGQQIKTNTILSIYKCHESSSCGYQSCSCLRTPFHKYHILCWGFGQNVALVGAASDWRCDTSANTLGTVLFLQNNLRSVVFFKSIEQKQTRIMNSFIYKYRTSVGGHLMVVYSIRDF